MRPRTRKKGSGRAPGVAEIKKMHDDGYETAAEAAERLDVAASTVYGWMSRKLLHGTRERPATKRSPSGNVWFLRAATTAMRPHAAEGAVGA